MAGQVLITGITGFTGRHLRPELEAHGYTVRGIADKGVNQAQDRMVNLLDVQRLKDVVCEIQPEFVVHLAGVAFAAHDRPDEFDEVHASGTENLLKALHENAARIKKVVLASSAYVYGPPATIPVDESVTPMPINPYGRSKAKMEDVARSWFSLLPLLIVRPFNYTGVGQSENFVLPKLVAHFRRRAPDIELADTSVVREFSDVRDVCRVYRFLMEGPWRSDVVNICSGRPHRLSSVFDALRNLCGSAPQIRRSAALERPNEIPVLVGSPRKLTSMVGDPGFRSLDETLQWMLNS